LASPAKVTIASGLIRRRMNTETRPVSVQCVDDSLLFVVERAWLTAPERRGLRRWVAASGAVEGASGTLALRIPTAEWRRWGTPPPGAGLEELDHWSAHQRRIALLAQVSEQILTVDSVGHLGGRSLSLACTVNGARIDAGAVGPIVRAGGASVLLLPPLFEVWSRVAAFNGRGTTTHQEQISFLGNLQGYLDEMAAADASQPLPLAVRLDEHLASIKIERVDEAALSWETSGKDNSLYSLRLDHVRSNGERETLALGSLDPSEPIISRSAKEHLLLSDDVAAAARAAKAHRGQLERQAKPLLLDPSTVLPEGRTYERIDLSDYSTRVVGFAPIEANQREFTSSGISWYRTDGDYAGAFLCLEPYETGSAPLVMESREATEQLLAQARPHAENGTTLEIAGRTLAPTPTLIRRLEEQLALDSRSRGDTTLPGEDPTVPVKRTKANAAVIKDTAKATPLATDDARIDESTVPWDVLRAALLPGKSLKAHQRHGIAWMWKHYIEGNRGVVLADDMGLGKTLQIACFLALQRAAGHQEDRTRPALIVSPVILLENWEAELESFFRPEIFSHHAYRLHDDGLRAWVRNRTLNLSHVGRYQYILTNYDTLAQHQQQLLKVDWASVVLDESQAVKNPDAYRSRAAQGLKRTFAICATGTPVENGLVDLWAQYEVVSPGTPFGSRKSFLSDYAEPTDAIPKLRAALRFPSAGSTLLRRTKADALVLPNKVETLHPIPMTPDQVTKERLVVKQKGGALAILQDLQKLYQHPRLLMNTVGSDPRAFSTAERIAESPKLGFCVDLLRKIQKAGEKVLVFTLWERMQDLLVDVLEESLGIDTIRVINGDSNQRNVSRRYLNEFQDSEGFNVLVLSPLAAGTGLTITAANHVIHYGRWWNPAKEDQATDRAYRIGQTREVHVHYPILHHPDDPAEGFDVKLHSLVERKRRVARDFLDPRSASEISSQELRDVLGEGASS
jgi:hypothetical protein